MNTTVDSRGTSVPGFSAGIRRTLLQLMLPLAVAGASGVAVHAVVHGGEAAGWAPRAVAGSIASASLYVAVMWSLQRMSFRWMLARRPLRSGRDVAGHVAVQTATTVGSFALAAGLARLLLPSPQPFGIGVVLLIGVVSVLASLIVNAFLYLKLFYDRLRAAEQAALRAELGALRAQINPHFLFNALNSIAALARTRPSEAEAVTEHLAELFRYSLRASREADVALAEELASAETYLAIEQARFQERLCVDVQVPQALRGIRIPSLILQPLVENAVKHGVSRTDAPCEVRVAASTTAGSLLLRVTDSGPGFAGADPATIFSRGTGLANVRDRLRAHSEGRATLVFFPDGVELRLPLPQAPS